MTSAPHTVFSASSAIGSPRTFLKNAVLGLHGSVDVARLMFTASLRSRHRRSLLGYLWLVVPALATAVTFTLLRRSQVFSTGDISMPYAVFVLSGVLLWQCFADAMLAPVNKLREHGNFLALVPTPLEGVVLAAMADVLLNSLVRLAVIIISMLALGIAPSVGWLTGLVPALAALMLAGLVVGLVAAPLAQLYDDAANLLGILATFGLFLVPALYPIPAGNVLALNPLATLFDMARDGMLGQPLTVPWLFILATGAVIPIAWLLNVAARPHLSSRTR